MTLERLVTEDFRLSFDMTGEEAALVSSEVQRIWKAQHPVLSWISAIIPLRYNCKDIATQLFDRSLWYFSHHLELIHHGYELGALRENGEIITPIEGSLVVHGKPQAAEMSCMVTPAYLGKLNAMRRRMQGVDYKDVFVQSVFHYKLLHQICVQGLRPCYVSQESEQFVYVPTSKLFVRATH